MKVVIAEVKRITAHIPLDFHVDAGYNDRKH